MNILFLTIFNIDLISERYRDLIEAADAIFEMKTCAKGVCDSFRNHFFIDKYFSRLNNLYIYSMINVVKLIIHY